MIELNVEKVGATIEHEGQVLLFFLEGGDMPPDCVAVFMSKGSWVRLKEEVTVCLKE